MTSIIDAVSPDDIFERVLVLYHGTCCKKTLDYM